MKLEYDIYTLSKDPTRTFTREWLDKCATELGTEKYLWEDEAQFRARLIARQDRFSKHNYTVGDIVNSVEMAIHVNTPGFVNEHDVRRRVALGLLSKNQERTFVKRLKIALRAFWSCL